MKYIKKMILENFQSHKYTEIELDQHLNVIIGPSDHGKTAIIRALKWVLFNEPSGDFFIREGAIECSVTVEFNNNIRVKRYRSRRKNAYYLYDETGKEIVFEGFGTNIPREILDQTSIRKIVLDGNQSSYINIGEQLEGPFLLSEKSATRANAIGRLVGIHIIDDALKDTLKDIKNLNLEKKNHHNVLEKLEKDLSRYDYLDSLIEKTQYIRKIKDNIYDKKTKLHKLNKMFIDFKKINEKIKLTQEYLDKLKNLQKVINIEEKLDAKTNVFNHVNAKYINLNKTKDQININGRLIDSLKQIYKLEDTIEKINICYNRLFSLDKSNKKYKYIVRSTSENKNILLLFKNLDDVEKNINLIKDKQQILQKLLDFHDMLDRVNKNLSIGNVYVSRLAKVEMVSKLQILLEKNNNLLKNLMDYKSKYNKIIFNILNTKKTIDKIEFDIGKQLEQYKFILTRIERCPLCFSKIGEWNIEQIINNYK